MATLQELEQAFIAADDAGNTEDASAFAAEIERMRGSMTAQPVALPQTQQDNGFSKSDLLAPWDAGLHFATGMAAAPVAGLAGILSGGNANVVHGVQNAMTYQPRTRLGGELSGIAAKPFELLAEGGDAVGQRVSDATNSPALGAGANTLVQSIPSILGSKGAAALRNSNISRLSENAVKNKTMRDSVNAGFKIPPSELAQTEPAKAIYRSIESFGGKEAMGQTASVMNNKTVNNLVRNDIGIKGKGQISEAELDAAKQPHFDIYEEAGNISQTAKEAKELWRRANFEEKRQRLFYKKSADPKAADAADAAKIDAETYMAVIENEANIAGRPDLVQNLKKARVELGKIGTVENALNEATGEVSANSLKKAKDRGLPLKGGMKQSADFSQAFKNKYTQDAVVQPGVSKMDAMVAALVTALKGTKGLALTGVPYAVRRALLSDAVQNAAKPPANLSPIGFAEQMKRAALVSALQQSQQNP